MRKHSHENPHPLILKHLILVDGSPQIIDMQCFEDEFRMAKEKGFEAEKLLIQKEYAGTSGREAFGVLSKKKSKPQTVERQALAWRPNSARMVLIGTRVTPGELREVG